MNKQRRKQLTELTERLEDVRTQVEFLRDEEDEAYNNLPESLQDGDRGSAMQNAIDSMDYAIDNIQDTIDNLSEASEN